MHERVVLLTVVTARSRASPRPNRSGVLWPGGFMEKPNITAILREAESHGVPYDPEATTYFLSREEPLRARSPICRRCAGVHSCNSGATRRSSATITVCRTTGWSRNHLEI